MPKYIDVDDFIERKRELYCASCERRMGVRNGKAGMIYEIGDAPCRACGIDDMLGELEDFPAADVAEVRHGRFLGTEFDGYADGRPVYYEWQCSACGCIFEDEEPTFRFCPYCGAKMDESEETE